jgi:hypothetical protein
MPLKVLYVCAEVDPVLAENAVRAGSGGMLVFAEDAAEAVMSVEVEAGELLRVGDRCGQRGERSGVREALVRSVGVVEGFVFA